MKKETHPTMYPEGKTTCTTCGAVFVIPSTVKEQSVEACKMCHPIYTGKKQTTTRGGRIDRFKKRLEAGKTKA